ncbi:hypothetical protein [Fulvimarina sp. MAC3]|uniref:hypothetical protein n=1 Tax=Fulvimarina sp. MAC3 TaxID=3148887 RepID=UPI0031FD40AC
MLNAPVPASATGLPLDRKTIEDLIESLIAMLDGMDADPDLEPSLGFEVVGALLDGEQDADDEPDLGSSISSSIVGEDDRPREWKRYWTDVDFEGTPENCESEAEAAMIAQASLYVPFADRSPWRAEELRLIALRVRSVVAARAMQGEVIHRIRG